jgi:hypothetical protein
MQPMNVKEILCHISHPRIVGKTGFVFICPGRFEEEVQQN